MADDVQVLLPIPPESAAARVVGFMKGKSGLHIRNYRGRLQDFTGQHFRARGCYIFTVG